jgi:tripartite ATP-independent transporter DctP family solute receptor
MFKGIKKFMLVALALVLVFNLVACSSGDDNEGSKTPTDNSKEPIVLRLAENQPDNNPVTIAMKKFAELVDEKTNGEVNIEVYANAQLGEESDNIEQVQAGALDMARVNSVSLAQTVKELNVFTLPYIFTSQEHKYEVLDGEIGQSVLAKFEEYDLVSFGYLEAGSRNFYTTKKPIKSLEDLKGQKIRVQPSEVSIQMAELLGAVPTPMNYGEVFSALQTGVIDGAENDFVSFYTSGHYEVAKHITLDEHLSPPALIIMSKQVWDGLSPEHQEAIREAADEATEFERKAMNDFQGESRAEVEKAGVTVYEVNVKEFQDAVAPIYDSYPEFKDIIDKIRSMN